MKNEAGVNNQSGVPIPFNCGTCGEPCAIYDNIWLHVVEKASYNHNVVPVQLCMKRIPETGEACQLTPGHRNRHSATPSTEESGEPKVIERCRDSHCFVDQTAHCTLKEGHSGDHEELAMLVCWPNRETKPTPATETPDYLRGKLDESAPADPRAWLTRMMADIHIANAKWWVDLETGSPTKRNVGELLCLIHSELSEAMEGHRKGLMDDKLPHRPMIEVELADALIRILDMGAGMGLDLSGAYVEKMEFNANREDHKRENRLKDGGKKY